MTNIKVDAEQWNRLSPESRAKISRILKDNGLLKGAMEIVADAPTMIGEASGPVPESLCKILCNAAEEAAKQLCNELDSPAKEVCLIAAKAAGEECRKNC